METKKQAYEFHKNGLSYKQIGNKLGISKTRAYEYVKEVKLLQGIGLNPPVPNGSELEKNDLSEHKNIIIPNINENFSKGSEKSTSEISVPASSEQEKNDSSEQKKTMIPNINETASRVPEKTSSPTNVPTSSELQKNVGSEHESIQKSQPGIRTEKPAEKTPEVKTFRGDDLIKKEFITYDYTGSKFYDLIGCPSKPFNGLIYGLPKSGKSYFCIFYADYMQEYHCDVLYNAAEEGESVTLQKKFKEINGSRVTVLPTRDRDVIRKYINTGKWQLVFIDSINNAGIDNDFLELIKSENPTISFVVICQATKAGNFKGDQALTHNCDFIIEVVAGVAKHTGRFNGNSEVDIFKEPLYEKNTAAIKHNQDMDHEVTNELDYTVTEEQQAVPTPPYTDALKQVENTPNVISSMDLANFSFDPSKLNKGCATGVRVLLPPPNTDMAPAMPKRPQITRISSATKKYIIKHPELTLNEVFAITGAYLGLKILGKYWPRD